MQVAQLKTTQVYPLCPNCNLPFKARVKRNGLEKLIYIKKTAKKYLCGQCNSKFLFVEEKQ
jgi:hypothetical protein